MPKKSPPAVAERPSVPIERIQRRIYLIRGQKVMLDSELAGSLPSAAFRLNEAVKRSLNRFPENFMFQLTAEETGILTSQIAMSHESEPRFRCMVVLPHSPPCYHEHSIMPDPRPQPSPISEAVTNDIRVEVLSRYSAENSRPLEDNWIFQYTVRITNQGAETVQLVSRHWIITDGLGHTEEVTGPGVVGEQPVLAPGESFQYSSWCPLKTPTGRMHGTYQMARADGNQFDIEIAPFALKAKYAVN